MLDPTNYSFSLYAAPTLLVAVAVISLGMIVLVGERHARVGFSFFVMTATAATWLLSYSVMYCALTESVATRWAVIGHLGVTLIPASVYHFTANALQIYSKKKYRVWLAWLSGAGFYLSVVWSDAFVSGVYRYGWGYYAKYDWLSLPFLGFFFCLMALSLRHYWIHYHSVAQGIAKERSKALFIAFCVAYLGSVDYLPALGLAIYPVGYLLVFGFIVLAARAIWRYRLVDITPAFAAEEIINAMADALLVLDNDGIVRVANRAARQIFDRPESQLIGAPIQSLTPLLGPPELELDRLVLSGSLRDKESVLPVPRAEITAVSASSFAMRDPEQRPVAFVCIVRDITQQKKAQEEIQRHTERQAALYEINLATTSTLELKAVLDVLLEKLARLAPRTAITVMLLSDNGRELIKVAARGIDEEAWKSEAAGTGNSGQHPVLASKDAIWASNLQLDSPGLHAEFFCQKGFVSYLGLPLITHNKPLGILSFYCREAQYFSDEEINFLKTLAGQAAGAIDNSQLYEQMRTQAIELEKANRVKDDFLSVMSHELRTPLNVIAGYTTIVQDGMLGDINPEQVKALEKVSRHSNELLVMVNSIMDATKIEAGGVVIEIDEFRLSSFLDDLKLLYEYPLGNVALEWDYPPDLPALRTDRDKLKHILQNLINNALKFTEQGQINISARERPGTEQIELIVTDSGVGIAPEDLPLVFDKFRQLDASRTRTQGGVGLGLHIVKTFTQLLGGTVSVTSQVGVGATFTITLPRVYDGTGAVRTVTRRKARP